MTDAPPSLTPSKVDCEEARSCHIISIQGHLAFLFGTKHEKQRLTYYYLRGTIIIRTYDKRKTLYIPLFLLTIFGPDYYTPVIGL